MNAVGVSHDSEDDVGLITDTVKSYRRDHHDHKVEDPVGTGAWLDNILNAGLNMKVRLPSRKCICGRTNAQWHDLCWIQPRHSEPTDGEEGVKNEEEDGLSDTRALVIQVHQPIVAAREHSHRDRHAGSLSSVMVSRHIKVWHKCMTYPEKHERPTSNLFDNKDGNERSHQVLRAVTSSEQLGQVALSQTNLSVELRSLRNGLSTEYRVDIPAGEVLT